MANAKKQKLIIQDVLSSPDIYSRTAGILKPSYFDAEYEPVVNFIHEYYAKYSATPQIDQVLAEHDIELEETKRITRDRLESTCDEIERFCRETAVKDAIYDSMEDVDADNMSVVLDRISQAVQISLQRDMGLNVYENPEQRLESLVEHYTPIPTGIGGIDGPLDGGLIRKQLTLFSANSGGGKSIMMNNIGNNYADRGFDVLYLTLELPEEMVFLRDAAIISGYDAATWKNHIPEIAQKIKASRALDSGGSFIIKRMKQHATASDIRSYLSMYEMEFDRVPDILIIDYLDLMDPNGGLRNMGIFEQDKRKAEEVVEILNDYDMIGISASQQNREALNISTPNHSIIAGGISKVNTVDNYISLFMDETMRNEGVMNAYFLKTRSSRGVGHLSVLAFDPMNLRITDPKDGPQTGVMPTKRKEKKGLEAAEPASSSTKVTAEVGELPGQVAEEKAFINQSPELFVEEVVRLNKSKVDDDSVDDLVSLMSSLEETDL